MTFVDLGCGYGTFTLAASSIVGPEGQVYAVDIDRKNVERVATRAKERGLENVTALVGDIMAENGTLLPAPTRPASQAIATISTQTFVPCPIIRR
jgi:FkbM family methyltransferase